MATLTDQTIASSYEQLLSLPDGGGNGTNLVAITDGDAGTTFALKLATTSISVGATNKIYLDGGNNTYLHESGPDVLDIVVGATTMVEIIEGGGGTSDSVSIQSGNKFNLGGSGGDTYIYESAADTMQFVAGDVGMLKLVETASTDYVWIPTDGQVLALGTGKDLNIYVNSDHAYIENITANKDIVFKVLDASSVTTPIWINGSTSAVGIGADPSGTATLVVTGSMKVTTTSLFAGDVTLGVDDTGVDLRVYSATASEGLLYDASEDELILLLTTKLKFHDVGGDEEIYASSNGVLVIGAGTKVDFNSPILDLVTQGTTIELKPQADALAFDGNADNILNINALANFVGIGTADPDMHLEINHGNATAINPGNITDNSVTGLHIDLTSNSNTAGSVIKLSSNGDQCAAAIAQIQVDASSSDLAFYIEASGTVTECIRIKNTGNVGIGTADPTGGTLHVNGSAYVHTSLSVTGTSALNDDVTIPHGKKIIFDSADTYIYANTEDPEDLHIAADQDIALLPGNNVGIGTEAPTAGTLHVNGSCYVHTTIQSPGTYSNELSGTPLDMAVASGGAIGINEAGPLRYKTNINDLGYNIIPLLRPVIFDSLKKDEDGKITDVVNEKNKVGLIAEEVAEVDKYNHIVAYNQDGETAGVSYTRLIPYLVKAIQELSAKVTALENA